MKGDADIGEKWKIWFFIMMKVDLVLGVFLTYQRHVMSSFIGF